MSAFDTKPTRRGPPQRPRLPLLTRLVSSESGAADIDAAGAADAIAALRDAVRHDLEALLNARRRRRPMPRHLSELASSIAGYGIPDPTSGSYAAAAQRDALVLDIETTIRRFEPRLANITVTLMPEGDSLGGSLHMKVDAILRADPIPEPVTFETLLEPVTRDVVVREV